MRKDSHDFNKVLEQYVFEIASSFIEPAEPTTQASFIDFFNRIDSTATPVKVVDDKLAPAIAQQLESEWQQVLDEPINWEAVNRQWRIDILEQQIKSREAYIDDLKWAVLTTLQQYRYTRATIVQEPYRSNLLDRQKRTLNMYRRHLAQVRSFQLSSEKQLNQLQSQ